MKYDNQSQKWKIDFDQQQSVQQNTKKEANQRTQVDRSIGQLNNDAVSIAGEQTLIQNENYDSAGLNFPTQKQNQSNQPLIQNRQFDQISYGKAQSSHVPGNNALAIGKITEAQAQENKYTQLMILLAAGEIDSCKKNAEEVFQKSITQFERSIVTDKQKNIQGAGLSGISRFLGKTELYNLVNTGLLLVKCILIQSREDAFKNQASEILNRCENVLSETLGSDLKDIKKRLYENQKEKIENFNVGQQDEKSSNLTKNKISKGNKRQVDFNDYRWMLSAIGIIASFYNSLGYQNLCEKVYVKYVGFVEEFYEQNSVETSNAYFMVGVYYFEQDELQKSLACFIKSLYIRKKELGSLSLGAADCHFNMAVIYKKLGVGPKALLHFQNTLDIRKKEIGSLSLQVSDVLEMIGKYYLETGELKQAYDNFNECYDIRKHFFQTSNPQMKQQKIVKKNNQNKNFNNEEIIEQTQESQQITRISILLVYLHTKINEQLQEKNIVASGIRTQGQNGLKLLNISNNLRQIIGEEVSILSIGEQKQKAQLNQSQSLITSFKDSFKKQVTEYIQTSKENDDQLLMKILKVQDDKINDIFQGYVSNQSFQNEKKVKFHDSSNIYKLQQIENEESDDKSQQNMVKKQQKQEEDDSICNEISINGMLEQGLDQFVNTINTKIINQTYNYVISFILSLTEEQQALLQKDQTSFQGNSFLYISKQFLYNELAHDIIQLNLFQNSRIWKIQKYEYLQNVNLPISIGNLKINEMIGASKSEKILRNEKDQYFIQMLKQVPAFIETLMPVQQRILQTVVSRRIPLKFFFISINEAQLTDFDQIHQNIKNNIEKQEMLIQISQNFPNKLQIDEQLNRNENKNLDNILTYKYDILKTIDKLKDLTIFFYLTDLPSEFTEYFSPDQDIRYANIIIMARKGYQLWVQKQKQNGQINQSYNQRNQEDFDMQMNGNNSINQILIEQELQKVDMKEYEKLIDSIKLTIIEFINNLDIHQVYQFVNFFPFLIDSQKMNEILQEQAIDENSYKLNVDYQEFDSNLYEDDPIQEEDDLQNISQSNSENQSNQNLNDLTQNSKRDDYIKIQFPNKNKSDRNFNSEKQKNQWTQERMIIQNQFKGKQLMPNIDKMKLSGQILGRATRKSILEIDPNKYFNNAILKSQYYQNGQQNIQKRQSGADMLTQEAKFNFLKFQSRKQKKSIKAKNNKYQNNLSQEIENGLQIENSQLMKNENAQQVYGTFGENNNRNGKNDQLIFKNEKNQNQNTHDIINISDQSGISKKQKKIASEGKLQFQNYNDQDTEEYKNDVSLIQQMKNSSKNKK